MKSNESGSMAVTKPIRRNCRQFVNGSYSAGGISGYIKHPKYADSPEHYIRAFLLLQKDLFELFDSVEPADTNSPCFSYRIHSLLLRACVEVEANCKAILTENDYSTSGNLNMSHYRKIDASHRLSSYLIKVPQWHGDRSVRQPFKGWRQQQSLPWYQAYNATKHDRHSAFEQATFDNLIDAACGLFALLSSQFLREDFSPGPDFLALGGPIDGWETGIGDFFQAKFPDDWPQNMRYNFSWPKLQNEPNPFDVFDYSAVE